MIEHWVDFVTAGVGKFTTRAIDVGAKAVTGEPIAAQNVPMVRRLVGEPSPGQLNFQFRQNKAAVDDLRNRLDYYVSSRDTEKIRSLRAKHNRVLALKPLFTQTANNVKLLRERQNRAQSQEEKDRFQERIDLIQRRANKRYYEAAD